MGLQVSYLVFGVQGLRFRVEGLGLGLKVLGFRVIIQDSGLKVS